MPNGRRRPYRCGGIAPSPEHSSDEEDIRVQKATYWMRAARGWRRWRRLVREARSRGRFVALILLRDGMGVGAELVLAVLRFLEGRVGARVFPPRPGFRSIAGGVSEGALHLQGTGVRVCDLGL